MVFLVDLNAMIFGMPRAVFPALAATHFGGGARTVGLLYAAPAIGGLIGAAFSGPLAHVRRQGLAVLVVDRGVGGVDRRLQREPFAAPGCGLARRLLARRTW